MTTKTDKFDDIRPFYDEEIQPAMQRIVADPLFAKIVPTVYPDKSLEQVCEMVLGINSTWEFQDKIICDLIHRVAVRTTDGVEIRGDERLDPRDRHLFVSNHRDIMLDSALTNVLLYERGFESFEITFGSNLMSLPLVVDFGRSNRMFRVERSKSPRELLVHSKHLSEYIRHAITEKRKSVWIAQRSGRTKDGNDATAPGLIKMLGLSGGQRSFSDKVHELNIVPVAISYEYEPCDHLKVQELYFSARQKYAKVEGEDIKSIVTGIMEPKGRVVITICRPVNELLGDDKLSTDAIAALIDGEIHRNYHLFGNNYVAWDIVNGSEEHLGLHYTEVERGRFLEYMGSKLSGLSGDVAELTARFLEIYSYPVSNRARAQGSSSPL